MTAPAACCLVDPQPPLEPMTDREEPVMTVYSNSLHLHEPGLSALADSIFYLPRICMSLDTVHPR